MVPMMARAGEISVNLAVSLHAVNKRKSATKSCRSTAKIRHRGAARYRPAPPAAPNNARRITFEYVMLKDKNDSDADAQAWCG